MARYDPNEESTYGLAGADFPITFYDRPSLMFASLLRGDVDGMTRSILSPSTLSPAQMKTIRDSLTGGKKTNPLLQTVLDVATNPLVIAGLILGAWKYPMAGTQTLLTLRKGLMPKAAAMGPLFDGLHDAMMNTRTIPGLWEAMHKVLRGTTEFATKWGDEAKAIFEKTGQFTKAEGAVVAARLDGLHTADHYMVKALQNEPEWLAFFGRKDVPIAANIQNTMRPETIGLSDRLRKWYDGIRALVTTDKDVLERVKKAVETKGFQFGEDVPNYFMHRGDYNRYYKQAIRGTTGARYREWLYKETGGPLPGTAIARNGGMWIDRNSLLELEKAGAIPAGFADRVVEPVLRRQLAEAEGAVTSLWFDVRNLGLSEGLERAEFVKRMTHYYTKGPGKGLDFVRRLGNDKMAKDTLDQMAGSLQEAVLKGPAAVSAEVKEIGRVLADPVRYVLDPIENVQGYLNSMSQTWAWHGTGAGQEIMRIVQKPDTFRNLPHIETYVMDNILPFLQGKKSWPQLQRSLYWSVQKDKIGQWVNNTPWVESTIGKKGKEWLSNYFSRSTGSSSLESLSGQIAQYFHLSTLGANPGPVLQNAMQNFTTTMGVVGPTGLYRGLMGVAGERGALAGMREYVEKVSRGVATRQAFREAFPEFVADVGEKQVQITESLLAGDLAREGLMTGPLKPVTTWWERAKRMLMTPFSTSESGNQIMAYYSGRNSHLHQMAGKLATASAAERAVILREAGDVGQTLNMVANFAGGPLGIPKAIMNMNPAARQFMHFPLRFAGFLQGTLRMGPDPSKLDWGGIGRIMAGSATLYETGKNMLGVDLSRGLLTGALPTPTFEDAPFYPWPLVPPIVGLAGSVAKSVFSGDPESLKRAGALLVPGGLAARKAYVGLAPKFADYNNRTEDGRIPVYNEGKALVGTFTPMQLTLRALGIKTVSEQAEQGASKWLLSQRDRIRQYRRDYINALYESDGPTADRINREFQRVYPELGPIQVKKSDIKALEDRRQISRLTRIAKGLPTAYRPVFTRVIGEAGLAQMTENIQMQDAGLLGNYLPQ